MMDVRPRILIVDDDPIVADSIAEFLRQGNYDTTTANSAEEAQRAIEDADYCVASSRPRPFSVMIADIAMPGMGGLELIQILHRRRPDIVPIAITGYGTIEQAVQAIRHGAIDYLTKPVIDDELRIAVEKAVQQHALIAENVTLRSQLDQRYGMDNIIGGDDRMRRTYEVIESVAPSKTTVLMCGESGTGKSLIARAIHRHSPRSSKSFVEISCGSIPETLLESELFGHMKGAFTGAHTDKPGKFLAAHEGTLFLDEINSASPAMQLKLLRVLQERRFEPVGSNTPIEVDVRVVLASNEPLEDLVASGKFRQDLYYRINVVSIQLPPLRDRIGDIGVLAEHFLEEKSAELTKQVIGFDAAALEALRRYDWPGNVRELENIIERAVVLTKAVRIGVDDLPVHVIENSTGRLMSGRGGTTSSVNMPGINAPYDAMPLRLALEEPEKQIILAALEANQWNRQKTAEQLDINRTTLYKKIKQYDLEQYGRTG